MTCPNCSSILEEYCSYYNNDLSNNWVKILKCTGECFYPNDKFVLDKDSLGKYKLENFEEWRSHSSKGATT